MRYELFERQDRPREARDVRRGRSDTAAGPRGAAPHRVIGAAFKAGILSHRLPRADRWACGAAAPSLPPYFGPEELGAGCFGPTARDPGAAANRDAQSPHAVVTPWPLQQRVNPARTSRLRAHRALAALMSRGSYPRLRATRRSLVSIRPPPWMHTVACKQKHVRELPGRGCPCGPCFLSHRVGTRQKRAGSWLAARPWPPACVRAQACLGAASVSATT
jgi:hypothetical protein